MPQNEFKLCNKCPTHSRYLDPDRYWCCKHPKAWKHAYDLDIGSRTQYTPETPSGYESDDEVPISCLKTCPNNHWKRTIEGGKLAKTQTELVVDSEWDL